MSNTSRNTKLVKTLDAAGATGWGTEIPVGDYRHVQVSIAGANSPTLTVKCAGSFLDKDDVDFASPAAVDNEWDYIHMYDYEDATGVNGDTGVSFTGSADVRQLIVNTDAFETLNFEVSSRSGGDVTVKVFTANNK